MKTIHILLLLIFTSALFAGWYILHNPIANGYIESHTGRDITQEYQNAVFDEGRECGVSDRYSTWTRYVCIYNISQDISNTERERGATSKAEEYFIYSFIYDNASFKLEPNKLYYIEYDLQLGYCSGSGRITSARMVMDYCNECTTDPDGRLQGCCKDVGCISENGLVR